MEGILALMIPVLAMATGFVAMLKRPSPGRQPDPQHASLADEVASLRLELAEMREKVEFTERLLTSGAPAAAPARPSTSVLAI
ncbi:MAG TPA: hypothetical protein VF665_07305 [Longimicrobium sp.]|jgi:hypothetical protein|uniref:hypothetical protein n=1 Tax=Longimicrobium sp. TaxID=2029185 RepID=UPI002ED975AB